MTTMQLEQSRTAPETEILPVQSVHLPSGLRGFSDIIDLDLVADPEESPFMWLCDTRENGLRFLVAEPCFLFQDYRIELFAEDVREIGITQPEDALVLNILTLTGHPKKQLFANQVGPVVICRDTGIGKQVIIQNYQEYSPRFPLLT